MYSCCRCSQILPKSQNYRKREALSSIGPFPRQPLQPELSWSNTKSQDFLKVLPHGCRSPKNWVILHCFPRPLEGSWIRSRTAGTPTGDHMGCRHHRQMISLSMLPCQPHVCLYVLQLHSQGEQLCCGQPVIAHRKPNWDTALQIPSKPHCLYTILCPTPCSMYPWSRPRSYGTKNGSSKEPHRLRWRYGKDNPQRLRRNGPQKYVHNLSLPTSPGVATGK